MSSDDALAFEGFELETAIAGRARLAGVELGDAAVRALSAHARAVIANNAELHLTSVVEPAAFLEGHLGESLEGASLLPG